MFYFFSKEREEVLERIRKAEAKRERLEAEHERLLAEAKAKDKARKEEQMMWTLFGQHRVSREAYEQGVRDGKAKGQSVERKEQERIVDKLIDGLVSCKRKKEREQMAIFLRRSLARERSLR